MSRHWHSGVGVVPGNNVKGYPPTERGIHWKLLFYEISCKLTLSRYVTWG